MVDESKTNNRLEEYETAKTRPNSEETEEARGEERSSIEIEHPTGIVNEMPTETGGEGTHKKYAF